MGPERMIGGKRLLAKDVELRRRQMAAVERRDEIGLDDMSAARRVDDDGAFRQRGEGLRVQDARGLGRQRQQADDDLAAREERLQALAAVKGLDACDAFQRAAPTRELEVERREL